MPEVSKDIIALLHYLLPGLLACWAFYGLTAHPRGSAFERVVQALIFTVVVQTVVILCREWFAKGTWYYDLGLTGTQGLLVWSTVTAILVGLTAALTANHDLLHRVLRLIGVTSRTSYPSEWFSSLSRAKRYVILHLEDGRRIRGWPFEWPDNPDRGHFVLMESTWLDEDGEFITMPLIEKFLISATKVHWVEIETDVVVRQTKIEFVKSILTKLKLAYAGLRSSRIREQENQIDGQQITHSPAKEPRVERSHEGNDGSPPVGE